MADIDIDDIDDSNITQRVYAARGTRRQKDVPLPVPLPLHPRADALQKSYDASKKIPECTYAEKVYFDHQYHDLMFRSFFGASSVNHYTEHSPLVHNIKIYALHRLIERGEIQLTAFDSTAAVTHLSTSFDTVVTVPFKGMFVLALKNSAEIILSIEHHESSIDWNFIAKTFVDIHAVTELIKEDVKNCNLYQDKVFTSQGVFINLPNAQFKDIYLDAALREEIQSNIFDYFNPAIVELQLKNNIPTKRGIIFAGDPGTGKTFLSRVIANSLPATFMVVTNIGRKEELQFCIDFMKQFSNSVILFEDIDVYLPDRELGSALLSTMLNALDGISINEHLLILCTTNNPESLDKAIKARPGRFDRVLQFDPPDKTLKTIMLKAFCSKHDCTAVDFDAIINAVPEKHTGAHIKELYITAVMIALNNKNFDDRSIAKLSTDIFTQALKKTVRKGKKQLGFDSK